MWKNKTIKAEAKKIYKANYWRLTVLCFVLVFFGVITGLGTTALNAKKETDVVKEQIADSSEQVETRELGIVDYLNAVLEGSDQTKQIANGVLESFKGTGGAAFAVFRGIDGFIIANDWAAKLVIVIAGIIYLFYQIFICTLLNLGYMRTLMEIRVYGNTPFKRVFAFFKKEGKKNVILGEFLCGICYILLAFLAAGSFVGGIALYDAQLGAGWIFAGLVMALIFIIILAVVYFRWYLVSYIFALNPETPWKEVLKLSQRMMKGNEWHALGLSLSFIGWDILSILTMGILDVFFVRPYIYQTKCEMFMVLREKALADGTEGAAVLKNDLLTQPTEAMIKGINVPYDPEMGIYPLEYPDPDNDKVNRLTKYVKDLNPDRKYSIMNLILFFFAFAIFGWVWEVTLYLVNHGEFINRGMMHGPWLPIYGFGGVLIIVFLRRFAKNPIKLVIATVLLCGVLEYLTSYFAELNNGARWWDYSNYFLNINGRVCFEGLLVFAIAGVAAIYFAGPLLDNIFKRIEMKKKMVIGLVLLLCFGGDMIYSHYHPNKGKGITEKIEKKSSFTIEAIESSPELFS